MQLMQMVVGLSAASEMVPQWKSVNAPTDSNLIYIYIAICQRLWVLWPMILQIL